MRSAFHADMAALDDSLATLSQQVAAALKRAAEAVLSNDLGLAESVIRTAVDIEEASEDVTATSAALLARQQPVAYDLRVLLGTQRVAGSLQRMGQASAQIAKSARRRYPRHVVPAEVRGVVADMVDTALAAAGTVTQGLSSPTGPHPDALVELRRRMSNLRHEMHTIVASAAWPYDVDTAVTLSLLSREFEHFVDHTHSVAATVAYVRGGLPSQDRS